MGQNYYIDAAMLRKRGACPGQIELFIKTFGRGQVALTEDAVRKALAAGLDVRWPATHVWWHASRDNDHHFSRLMDCAIDADTPKQILAVLRKAPAAWKLLDKLEAR